MDHLDTKQNWGAEAWRKPAIPSEMTEIYSECGRVIQHTAHAVDYRSHWFVMAQNGRDFTLYVKHGGGEESVKMPWKSGAIIEALSFLESQNRYLAMRALYKLAYDARHAGAMETRETWAQAFAEGRIKKRRKNGMVRVEIEPRAMAVRLISLEPMPGGIPCPVQ